MKISVNGLDLFELSDVQKKVICNEICIDDLDSDLKRRLQYILMHKYEQCFKRLKDEWDPVLAQRIESVPTDPDKYAALVFEQADYKDRKMRDAEESIVKG